MYSLGVVLFELLTGELPFRGNARMLVHQVINDEPPGPRRLNGSVPRDLETICLKCLEKEPGKRYVTASALADDVRRFVAGAPIEACPPSTVYRLRKYVRRNKVACGAVSMVLLTLIAGIVATTIGLIRQRELPWEAEQAKRTAQQSAIEAKRATGAEVDARRELESQTYTLTINAAFEAWQSGTPKRLMKLLQDATPQGRMDFRGFEWQFLQSRLTEAAHQYAALKLDGLVAALPYSSRDAFAFSPSDKYLAVAAGNQAVLCELAAGERLIQAHGGPVLSCAISPNERYLAVTTAAEATVTVLRTGERSRLPILNAIGKANIQKVAFVTNAEILVAGTATVDDKVSGWVRTWTISSDEPFSLSETPLRISHSDTRLRQLEISADGHTLATSGDNGSIKLWSLPAGELISNPNVADRELNNLSFSAAGDRLAFGGYEGVKLWNVKTNTLLNTIGNGVFLQAHGTFSCDGRWFVSVSAEGTRLWNVRGGIPEGDGELLTWERSSVRFSPNGESLATAPWFGSTVRLWDAGSRRQIMSLLSPSFAQFDFSHDGRFLATGSVEGSITVWDVKSLRATTCAGDTNPLVALALSPDRHTVATSTSDRRVKLWDTATGEVRLIPSKTDSRAVHRDTVQNVSFSPDGSMIASSSCYGVNKIWDSVSGRVIASLDGSTGQLVPDDYASAAGSEASFWTLAFSPDGEVLASGTETDGTVRLWETQTWRPIAAFFHQDVLAIAFSKDGRQFVTGGTAGAKIWNLAEAIKGHSNIAEIEYPSSAYSCVFSPDDTVLAIAGRANIVRLCNARTGKEERLLTRDGDWLSSVAFSPDGSCIVTASPSGEIIFWKTSTGERLGTIRIDEGVRKVAFFPNGDLVAASMNGILRAWRAAPAEEDR